LEKGCKKTKTLKAKNKISEKLMRGSQICFISCIGFNYLKIFYLNQNLYLATFRAANVELL
jgi:hypothetical protein